MFVRFDDGKLQEFGFWEPSDGRVGAVGINGPRRFIGQLRKSKTVKIEAEFWQEGTRVFEFDVHGLDKNW